LSDATALQSPWLHYSINQDYYNQTIRMLPGPEGWTARIDSQLEPGDVVYLGMLVEDGDGARSRLRLHPENPLSFEPTPVPVLDVAADDGVLVLSWDAGYFDFNLHVADRLVPSRIPGHELEKTVWTKVDIAPVEIEGRLELRIEPTETKRFYQLIR